MIPELRRSLVETPLARFTVWSRPEPADALDPVLVVLPGAATSLEPFGQLAADLEDACHVAVWALPNRGGDGVLEPTVARVADALGPALHAAYSDRAVVLLGFSDGALAALAIRAAQVLRVLAVEPPLRSESLGPVRDTLAGQAGGEDAAFGVYLRDAFGLGDAPAARDHTPLFAALAAPVDVLLGDLSSTVVDASTREALAARPGVNVMPLPDAGLVEVVRAALRQAATMTLGPDALARRLALAAPRDAGRLLYSGPRPGVFAAAYAALNPRAVVASAPAPGGAFDVVVSQHAGIADEDPGLPLENLAAAGVVVASRPLGGAGPRLAANLQAQGLALLHGDPELTPPAASLVRARKGAATPPLEIDFVTLTEFLMDIRTSLPVAAMRTDPDLQLSYARTPFRLSHRAAPGGRVVILQRPGAWEAAAWQRFAARAQAFGALLVLEYDDHPELVFRMTEGREMAPPDWEAFRVVHAIQTTNTQLAEVFSRHNPEVAVFANAVFDLPPFPAGRRAPRVFYGGVTRGPFAAEAARALGPAIDAHPDAEFVVVGDRAVFDALPSARKQYAPYVTYARYLQLMSDCSVVLSPLDAAPLLETKSDAKYLDAARCGALMIASPTVYERAIRPGENGLIARDLGEWPVRLACALADQAGRERMARAAWEEVRADRMFADQMAERRDWYRGLLARRSELDAAVLERSPDVAAVLAKLRGA